MENLQVSKKRRTFAALFEKSIISDRDLAQLVAHTSGGREVAVSSPVIPTKGKEVTVKMTVTSFFFYLIPSDLDEYRAYNT